MRAWPLSIIVAICLAGAAQAQSAPYLLHDALHLSPAQEDAWTAYQSAIASDPEQQARARQTELMLPNLATPRRLALIRAQMEADLAAFDHNAQAVNAFYAVLTPAQQRTFDKQTAPGQQPSP